MTPVIFCRCGQRSASRAGWLQISVCQGDGRFARVLWAHDMNCLRAAVEDMNNSDIEALLGSWE